MPVSRLPVPPASLALAVLATGLLAVAGCGDDGEAQVKALSPAEQVRVVVRSYGLAVANKDYQTICDRLIARELSDNVEQYGLPCELAFKQGLGSVKGATLRIDGIRLRGGSTAFVRIHTTAAGQPASDDTLELVRGSTGWRITSLSAADAAPATATTTGSTPARKRPPGAKPAP